LDKCPSSVDALCEGNQDFDIQKTFFLGPGQSVYLFQGSKIYELRGGSVTRVHSLRTTFPKGPIYVEAAFYNPRSQTMALFQSRNVFVFDYTGGKFSLDPSYPKRVPTSIGFNPTGALQWSDGNNILFSVRPF
jgi:hypothetical protein